MVFSALALTNYVICNFLFLIFDLNTIIDSSDIAVFYANLWLWLILNRRVNQVND